jgi:hypothetical protein
MHLWVEPAGGEQKSADVEQKTVTLIYPYPIFNYCHENIYRRGLELK